MSEQNIMNQLLRMLEAFEKLSILSSREKVEEWIQQVEKCRLIYGERHFMGPLKRRREGSSSEDEIPCKIRKLNECP